MAVKPKSVHLEPKTFDHELMRDPFYDDADEPAPAFREYVAEVWRYRWMTIAAGLLAAALMFGLDLFTPKIYVGTATLAVAGSKIGDASASVPAQAFLPIIANHTTAAEIIKEHHLDGPPYKLTPILFFRNAVDVTVIRLGNLIEVTAWMGDPQLAAQIANEVANRGVEFANVLSRQEAVRARDLIKEQLDDLRTKMDTSGSRLLAFKRTSQIDLVRNDVTAKLKQRQELPKLLIEIANERASFERWERELGARDKLNVTTKSIERDPTMMEAARNGDAPILPLSMKSEDVNLVYASIDEELAKSRAKLAGLERQRTQLMELTGFNAAEFKALTDLYQKESQFAQLQLEYDISQRAFSEVAARHENARLQVASRSAEVQVVDYALPFSIPVKPRPVRDTFFGALGGVLIAALVIVVRKSLAPPPPRPTPARLAS